MFAFQQSTLLFLANFGERSDVQAGFCVVERGGVVFVMSCSQLHHHELPNKSEAPMFAFQQNALLFPVDLGERPDVSQGLAWLNEAG